MLTIVNKQIVEFPYDRSYSSEVDVAEWATSRERRQLFLSYHPSDTGMVVIEVLGKRSKTMAYIGVSESWFERKRETNTS